MGLKREEKEKIISLIQRHEKDTGSPEVQFLLLNARINLLEEYHKKNPKDNQSYRTLLKLYAKRRKLRNYIMENYPEVFKGIRDLLV
ncbi:MAG: 30S ribosomal protein S15 [bacterium]|jgi:small subunit ribosomal protein S15